MNPNGTTERNRWWRRAAGRLLDWIYTPACELCGVRLAAGRALCAACDAELPRVRDPFCARCGEPFDGCIDDSFTCPNCSNLTFKFAFARAGMVWDARTRALVHALKYDRALHLADELGRLAVEALADPRFGPALAAGWPLVPVPLHRTRFQHRNFNQAVEIARVMGRRTGLPVVGALKRVRRTDTQVWLGRRERLANLRGAFVLTRAGLRQLAHDPAGVIVVDDVLTTGSTVEACAATLRKAGFQTVLVATVMRG